MELESKIKEAVLAELGRQAETAPDALSVEGAEQGGEPSFVTLDGTVDLDALAMAIAGALAGGP